MAILSYGQVGWRASAVVNPTPGVDTDAQAFITAATITNPTQQSAIDTLVKSLKSANIWTKMKALYPFVGGTAAQHRFNLKDPRTVNAAFYLDFLGGVTHSSSGVVFGGINGYANTKLIPSTSLSLNSNGFGIYLSTLNSAGSDPSFLGAYSTGGQASYLSPFNSNTQVRGALNGTVINSSIITPTGLLSFQKTTSTLSTLYKNSTGIGNGNSGGTLPAVEMFIGCLGIGGTYNPSFTNVTSSFTYVSDGLTSTEVSNLYTAVQAYQTTLGRNV